MRNNAVHRFRSTEIDGVLCQRLYRHLDKNAVLRQCVQGYLQSSFRLFSIDNVNMSAQTQFRGIVDV